MPSSEQFQEWFKENRTEILQDFFTFLSFQSISTDPHFNDQSRLCAKWLCQYMNKIGLATELWETEGLPVVFGSCLKAGKNRPTLLIYHHYDVQPVDPLELWENDPFQPVIKNGNVYARGAVDNKGQCFYSLTAIKAFFQLAAERNFNLKVFIEGEEESGGKGTSKILEKRAGELQADHLLVVDFDIPSPSSPAITIGMRGIITLNIECSNSSIDLHSGVHGGIALNPNRVLATLLAGMWDKNGTVNIPHFYDDLASLSKEQLSHVDMTFDQEEYTKTFGIHAFCNERGYSIKESNWLRPTLEINGMSGGYTGVGFKTVIPAAARAKISCRLVPNQIPEKIARSIADYLTSLAPSGIKITVDFDHGAPAFCGNFDSFIVKTAALAYEEVLGKPCKYLFCGASVPIVVGLARASCAEVAMIGVGIASDNIHAPNEHFSLERFENGYLILGNILNRISQGI